MAPERTLPHFESTTAWLLQSHSPSLRYLTLTRILGCPETHPDAVAARLLIAAEPPASKIIAAQAPDGWFDNDRNVYSPKYRSSHWSMLQLAEMSLPPDHPAMQAGAAFMRRAMESPKQAYFNLDEPGFGCYWGNWLRYELCCGQANEPVTQRAITFMAADLLRGCTCSWNAGLPCAWGVARGLFGLALLPENKRSPEVASAIQAGIRFLLEEHNLMKADYPSKGGPHAAWARLNYPLHYHADRLFVLRVMKDLGALGHPGAQPALQWLLDKQKSDGTWAGSSELASRSRPLLAGGDGPERWVTLRVLEVLV